MDYFHRSSAIITVVTTNLMIATITTKGVIADIFKDKMTVLAVDAVITVSSVDDGSTAAFKNFYN